MFDLNALEKRTFGIHLTFASIEGVIRGVVYMNEFIIIKSLLGSQYQLGLLFQFSVMFLLVSVVVNEILRRFPRKKTLFWVSMFTRLPLMIFLFFPADMTNIESIWIYHWVFLAVFGMYYFSQPFVNPNVNYFLKKNYREDRFGKLYSYSESVHKAILLVSTFVTGILLDWDPRSYRYIYPSVAILGMTSIFLLSRLDDGEKVDLPRRTIAQSLKDSYRSMVNISLKNKAFRDFELGFMLYGFAFMLSYAILTIFLEKELQLNYTSFAFYKNSYNIVAVLILPFVGKLIDKIDPRKFAMYTYGSMLLFIFFNMVTYYFPSHYEIWDIKLYHWLLVAYFFNGIFAATMALLWWIGSSYFCEKKDAADYQSVHLTLVGARGLLAPLFGVWLFNYIGYTGIFIVTIILLALSMWTMKWSMKKKKFVNVNKVELET